MEIFQNLSNIILFHKDETKSATEPHNESCRYVMSLPQEERCDFVYKTKDCSFEDDHILKPESWVFCSSMEVVGIVGMVFSLALLFLIISVVADAFVCPSVAVMASVLHMSENLAGVTILAFGNGAPDLFTELAGAELDHPEILFAGLTGSSLFVSTLVAGCVIFARPFHLQAWPLIINIAFLLASYIILFLSFETHTYGLTQPIVLQVIYILYIVVTVIESYIEGEFGKYGDLVEKDENEIRRIAEQFSMYIPPQIKYRASVAVEVFKNLQKEKIFREMGYKTSSFSTRGHKWKDFRLMFQEFLTTMNPVEVEDWEASGWCARVCLIIQGFIKTLLKLVIPVVSSDQRNNGWCKGLIMINMIIYPTFLVYSFGLMDKDILGLPVYYLTLLVGVVLSVITFFTTAPYEVSRFHNMICFPAFIGSIMMIQLLANELVMHLQAIGARFNLSGPLLALTLLALGNSLGDMVIDYGLAKQGMQNMGLAACFGGPMFNGTFGISLISLLLEFKGHRIFDFYGELSPTGSLFLLISLSMSLIIPMLMNFHGRSSYGLFLILLYFTYLTLIFLQEFLIHPFGTEHTRRKRVHHKL